MTDWLTDCLRPYVFTFVGVHAAKNRKIWTFGQLARWLLVAEIIFMNGLLYLLYSVADVNPMVGRSQLYFEFTKRVSSPSTLYVAFILVQGRQTLELDVCISLSFSSSELSDIQLVARASFVVLLTVAGRNWSMRHLWSVTGKYILLQRIWLYSFVATDVCDCFSDFLFLSLP